MRRIFADTDVFIDLLAERDPFYIHSATLFSLADKGLLEISVSSLTFANLNYLLSRHFTPQKARKLLLRFKTLVNVLPVTDKMIELALTSDFKDFEDGIQYFTAVENQVEFLITRNLKDYKNAKIPVFTPEQFLKSELNI
jgi:predicted nucleic acid-binding protein